MGDLVEPVDEAILLRLQYEVDTEEFDRTLPGRMNEHGEWIPFDRSSMIRFARQKHDEMLVKARGQRGVSIERMNAAKRYFEERPFRFEYLREWLKRAGPAHE